MSKLKSVNAFKSEIVADMLSVVEHEIALRSLGQDEDIDGNHIQYFSILHKCLMIWLFYPGIKDTKLNDIMK